MDETRSNRVAMVIGVIVVIGLLWAGYRWFSARRAEREAEALSPTPAISLIDEERKLEEETNLDVPESGEKTSMGAVGGASGMAIARRDGNFVSVTANLPEPEAGVSYQAWLVNGERKLIGLLVPAKGGYMTENTFSEDVAGFKKIQVTRGETEVVLEGNFQ